MRGVLGSCLLFALAAPLPALAQVGDSQDYLRDRGTGMPTSMFGTYIRKGELMVYPFFEYYKDGNLEYKPSEMGFGLAQDFRGEYRANEGILFLGYGLTDRLAVEFEAAYIDATFEKAPEDPSGLPARITETGTGDVEGQLRFRWMSEQERRPELFSYFEAVSPQQRDKLLIGTADWELKLGTGLVKGYRWGTLTVRAAGEYTAENGKFDSGEYAVEYLRRLSPTWRVYAGFEGVQDELGLITELQWRVGEFAFLKLNNALGVTSKSTDWAPEIGILFAFPTGGLTAGFPGFLFGER
jgi:hypothetical protein